MFREAKVLVTGGTGMIGFHFVRELLDRGARVRTILHRRSSIFDNDIETVRADLCRFEESLKAVGGIDYVIHAAGVTGGSKRVTVSPFDMFCDNVVMNTHLLEAARRCGAKGYLFVSNSSVYAPSEHPLKEEDAWAGTTRGAPENETGEVKRLGESQCALYARFTSMRIRIIRGGNAYGPFDNFDLESSHVIPALVRKLVEGQRPLEVWGDGTAVRDFIHARDLARGGLHVLEHAPSCDPINVATGRSCSISDVARILLAVVGEPGAAIRFEPSAPPASPVKRLDVTRMRDLGFEPALSLEEGLRRTVDWYRERK